MNHSSSKNTIGSNSTLDSTQFEEAKKVMPGGVNSPVRSFSSVGRAPVFIEKAQGPFLYSTAGNRYLDYVCSWGAVILGHANSVVQNAVSTALDKGLSFGAASPYETHFAKQLIKACPSSEKVRLLSTGTEATMTAIRLARGYTGRDLIVKFEGCYHGHVDSLLVEAGSGALTLGVPSSAGVPSALSEQTIVLPYNDTEALIQLFEEHGFQIAAVIVEPIAGNMGMVPATPKFLKTLRSVCSECDTVLIFDEVMSGFRVAHGGAQSLYKIKADLVTYAKVIGGGLPLAALGGKSAIMDMLSPLGPVYQAGTLSGNPIAIAAGGAVLEHIQQPKIYTRLSYLSHKLTKGLESAALEHQIPLKTHHAGGMWGMTWVQNESDTPPQNLTQIKACSEVRFQFFFSKMLEHGVYLAPSMYEAGFISLAHTDDVIEKTIDIASKVFFLMRKEGL